ncbi:MAG: carboxymuconolactone decarboxylase family protein [Emcibacteraceae bacterium]
MTLSNTPSYPAQLKHIGECQKKLSESQPKILDAFDQLHRASIADGALNKKTKELIALAIAVVSRCDGCISFHTHDALEAGASEQEITEALGIAILMGGGPAMVYATHVMDAMSEFKALQK